MKEILGGVEKPQNTESELNSQIKNLEPKSSGARNSFIPSNKTVFICFIPTVHFCGANSANFDLREPPSPLSDKTGITALS